jgi:hypothetical protein
MSLYDGPGDRLAGNLSLIVDNYRDERERYWSEDGSEAALIRLLDVVAHAILTDSSDLLVEGSDEEPWKRPLALWAEVIGAAETEGVSQHLGESLEIRIAEDVVNGLYDAPQRCLELAAHILAVRPAEPVRRYLGRLGRCYIAGLLPECVILCRAVLENAVNEALHRRSDDATEFQGTMRQKLRRCEEAGWLDGPGRRDAGAIWERGNKAVHQDPLATTDVFGTVVLTMGVLAQLYDDV